ncbi:flagellar motor protein MotB [Paenibacillus puerhi]|uniref:flagellar motor protein MotB n=1 Tax=Paenibacillus puerhi TaxID=2692622 RepID=UPI001356CB74|nr:flagellar motor protein MotB [Paenibacillus puerhi]
MARRTKRKRGQAPENHERWLITYSDLITLLLIFFIIMYAMSQIDAQKYEVLAQSLKFEFTKSDSIVPQGQGITGSLHPPGQPDTSTAGQDKGQTAQQLEKEKQLEDLLEKVQAYIEENNLQAQVSAADTRRGVAVTLNDLFLFDLGKAELKQDAVPILTQLAALFQKLNSTVSIEGHTDDLPLSTGSVYKDNWGLSQARSLSVLRYFIYDAQMDAKKFVSTSYADTRPVADNTSEENRAKNRRVEIVVLR